MSPFSPLDCSGSQALVCSHDVVFARTVHVEYDFNSDLVVLDFQGGDVYSKDELEECEGVARNVLVEMSCRSTGTLPPISLGVCLF